MTKNIKSQRLSASSHPSSTSDLLLHYYLHIIRDGVTKYKIVVRNFSKFCQMRNAISNEYDKNYLIYVLHSFSFNSRYRERERERLQILKWLYGLQMVYFMENNPIYSVFYFRNNIAYISYSRDVEYQRTPTNN